MKQFTYSPLNKPEKVAEEWVQWVSQWKWDRFVTLTFNNAATKSPLRGQADRQILAAREKLKAWDARMQRKLIGRKWASNHDQRLFCTYVPEKATVNIHWHGLVRLWDVEGDERRRQLAKFDEWADRIWRDLVPPGNADVKEVHDDHGIARYTSKSLTDVINFEYWVAPDEFWRP
ncbi:hypothetical protein SAMN05428969_3408 [Devosia sp. YR412]|uniref:hypothetical protein n=1 Tax=Devosia sp. YR412 TaxID=1881030 RepID=UPI0008D36184|nr:hypothetical protein [Devosia sp. YR412]SEQ53348.1 hypothetical protein SAMN05428969_3408 [Devosia sp. YR412]